MRDIFSQLHRNQETNVVAIITKLRLAFAGLFGYNRGWLVVVCRYYASRYPHFHDLNKYNNYGISDFIDRGGKSWDWFLQMTNA